MERVVDKLLQRRVADVPDAPYVKCGGAWRTYAEVDRAAERVAAGLGRLGIGKGDRVALVMPSRDEMIDLFFGCARLGAIQVPLNYWLKGEFLQYQLQDCGAAVLVADEIGYRAAVPVLGETAIRSVVVVDDKAEGPALGGVPLAMAFADFLSDDPAPQADLAQHDVFTIMYTSGTTGYPKGCMLSHGYYTAAAAAFREVWVEPGDRLFGCNPLFHTSGQIWLLTTALYSGISVCIEPVFSATDYIARAAEEDATVIFGLGSMAMAVLARPESPSDGQHPFRLAAFIPLAPAKQEEFARRFRTPVTAKCYGQTEVQPVTLGPWPDIRKLDTAGVAAPAIEIRTVDDLDRPVPPGEIGEIVLRPREPDVMFSGYWNKPEATADAFRNLWYHTGDYGRLDEEGYLTFVDRKKDALRRRGENVSSFELELAIARHPDVATVAVCAVPSPLGEDDIKACIVGHDSASFTPGDLFDFFKNHLPYFAIPRYVEIRDSLPLTVTGRIRKHILRDEGVTPSTWDFEALGFVVAKTERR